MALWGSGVGDRDALWGARAAYTNSLLGPRHWLTALSRIEVVQAQSQIGIVVTGGSDTDSYHSDETPRADQRQLCWSRPIGYWSDQPALRFVTLSQEALTIMAVLAFEVRTVTGRPGLWPGSGQGVPQPHTGSHWMQQPSHRIEGQIPRQGRYEWTETTGILWCVVSYNSL